MAKKPQSTSVNQTAIGNDNIQVVGSNNVITRITNFFAGDTEQQRTMRNRRAMLELVKNTWIEGVLEKSLYNEVLIELGMEERRSAVDHPWDMQVQMPKQTNRTLSAGTSIIDVFDEMNGAMLILGEPGSGKTTMLLELARDCIVRAEQDDNQSIPVIFNLSSWSDQKQSIDDWLVNELNKKYNVAKKTAQSWVGNDELQLLLDGLDEVKLDSRAACVKAINDFRQKHGLIVPVVVCSRIADYEALKAKLNLSGAVLLQPLMPNQIDEYFEQAGSGLGGVHQILNNDEILQELVKQPLMLSILILAYQGNHAGVFAGENSGTVENRRKHLFDTYIQQMFERVARTKTRIYTPEQTKNWLGWLAQKMIAHNQILYLLENMQTSWLSQKKQWRYRLINGLFDGLIFGLIYVLISGLIIGLVSGSINGLIEELNGRFFIGFIIGLIGGLILSPSKIEMVDTLTWDWKQGGKGLIVGFIYGLVAGLIFGLIAELSNLLLYNNTFDLPFGLTFVLTFGLVGGLIGGVIGVVINILRVKPISQTTYPGQRIVFSIRNFFSSILLFEIFFGLIFGLIFRLRIWLGVGLIFGLIFGLIGGLGYGGGAVMQHYVLRFIIAFNKFIPLDLTSFLDYCAERVFLRRVGGGYIFVHRLLMEHFAAMYSEREK